jgi:hypothetical protein
MTRHLTIGALSAALLLTSAAKTEAAPRCIQSDLSGKWLFTEHLTFHENQTAAYWGYAVICRFVIDGGDGGVHPALRGGAHAAARRHIWASLTRRRPRCGPGLSSSQRPGRRFL